MNAVNIDTGRQLFVDDALIETTGGVVRHWNKPTKIDEPLVWPGGGAAPKTGKFATPDDPVNLTCATDGGLWWDPTRRKFRLWYQADWLGDVCYAESDDGLSWEYPDLGIVPGTNRLFDDGVALDSWSVMPNYVAANPYADWKLHISSPGDFTDDRLWESGDGIHFNAIGVAGLSGDRTTSYYDPFRGEWVFSLRDYRENTGRCRRYFASRDFGGARWRWPKRPDGRDFVQPEGCADAPAPEEWLEIPDGIASRRQLYSFNAVAYESVMLGVMEILSNTACDNGDCSKRGLPKQTGLHFCFSRDGKSYEPREEPDIATEGWGSGKWDTGYLSCTGGICVIKDERLWFYYSGLRGDPSRLASDKAWHRNGMYSSGSIGAATLRRDGFAGMVADGDSEIVTKPLVFDGGHLFVNAECRFGFVGAEILGDDGKALSGFTSADGTPFATSDSTKTELRFKGGDLSSLSGRPVRIRFRLNCATLYSFWVSPSERGESRGYVAAGGPAYPGLKDL